MSVQVSYKKQTAVILMLLVTLLIVVEIIVNVWWNFSQTCAFEDDELFKNLDSDTKKQLCSENLDLQYTDQGIKPVKGKTVTINSHGFRGPEITELKPENTYRIFVAGGSTTFGAAVFDEETPPAFLQKNFDKTDLDFKVQVINAGIPGMWSESELQLVKTRLVNYEPDLIIIYDGVNELSDLGGGMIESNHILWKERLIEICEIGKQYGFETIATLQPLAGTGNRIPTAQETNYYLANENRLKKYPLYVEQLDEIANHCTETADLREIFDHIEEPIFFDTAHVNAKGNKIVGDNLYRISLPVVLKNADAIKNVTSNVEDEIIQIQTNSPNESNNLLKNSYEMFKQLMLSYKTPRVIFNLELISENWKTGIGIFEDQKSNQDMITLNLKGANMSGWDFSGRNLEMAIFYDADLRNADFTNANLAGADFRHADISGINFEGANLRGANLSNLDLTYFNLKGMDLSYTNLSETDLSWSDLSHVKLINANLTKTKLIGTNLSYANLEGSIISNSDFSIANLIRANLNGVNLSYSDFTIANLREVNLQDAEILETIMHATNLMNADLTGSKLTYVDLFDANLQGAIMEGTEITDSNVDCDNHPVCQ